MTKLKELAISELNSFNSIEMAKVFDFIQLIKDNNRKIPHKPDTSYLKVREALKDCTGSLSDEILHEREEFL